MRLLGIQYASPTARGSHPFDTSQSPARLRPHTLATEPPAVVTMRWNDCVYDDKVIDAVQKSLKSALRTR